MLEREFMTTLFSSDQDVEKLLILHYKVTCQEGYICSSKGGEYYIWYLLDISRQILELVIIRAPSLKYSSNLV